MAAARKDTVVPPPPRFSGDQTSDLLAMSRWVADFFRATVLESGLLDPNFQATAGTFDPNNLPDPAASSIAKAQDTANHAIEALKAHGLYP